RRSLALFELAFQLARACGTGPKRWAFSLQRARKVPPWRCKPCPGQAAAPPPRRSDPQKRDPDKLDFSGEQCHLPCVAGAGDRFHKSFSPSRCFPVRPFAANPPALWLLVFAPTRVARTSAL